MKSSSATPIIVAVVGVIACIIAAIVITVSLIQPTQDKIASAESRIAAAAPDATPEKHAAAQKLFDDNTLTAQQIAAAWKVKERNLMPPFDVSKRDTAWKQLSQELSANLGPSIERWMSHSGVLHQASIRIQAPPASPNQITGSPLVIPIAGGNLQVQGDFRSILAHVLKWNDFNRLVLIDKLQLSGNSPGMNGSYTANVIIFPQNGDKLGGTIAKNGSATGSPGMGGGGAGGPGGGRPAGA